jgi:hypothetical protein
LNITDSEFQDFADRLDAVYRDDLKRDPLETFVDPLGRGRWATDYYMLREDGLSHDAAFAEVKRLIYEIVGIENLIDPPVKPVPNDLVKFVQGYVRTQGRRWADDSGLRSFRICSWFPALRCFRDHREAALLELDNIAAHWQGVRIFWHVWTGNGWAPGYEVDPRWPDFDELFVDFLLACRDRGLRVSLSCGDMQDLCPDSNEVHWHEHIAELAASVDQMTVSWFSIWNEGWKNAARPTPDNAAYISNAIQRHFPWGAHGLSDPQDQEEAIPLSNWSRPPANFTLVHGTRDFPSSIRRAFNLVYEGQGWLLNQDEPVGAGPNVTARDDNPRHLFALYTMHLITGQMTTFFGGHALKSWTPTAGLERDWGFRELPELWSLMNLPENFQEWELRAGHRSDAAIYATSYADRGNGPERCDGAQNGDYAWFIPSGGRGIWDIRSRWNATFRIWTHEGLAAEGTVSAGGQIFSGGADTEALIIELVKQ